MSVINISSEDEDAEEECVIVSLDEDHSTLQNAHTIFVDDDDDSKGSNCVLPDDEKATIEEQLSFMISSVDDSEDPFSMCSEFEIITPSEKNPSLNTTNGTLSDTNVKPVHIEEIMDCFKNKTLSWENNDMQVIKPKTDSDFVLNTTKETLGVESCDLLNNSADAGCNKQDSNSLKKLLAGCLASLIKNKSIKTHMLASSSEEPQLLCLSRQYNASVDSIIDKVSKSSFSIDEYMSREFKRNDESRSKNKFIENMQHQLNPEDKCINPSRAIEGHNSKTIKAKRGCKRGWKKYPQVKLKNFLCTSNGQISNSVKEGECEPTDNNHLKEASIVLNTILLNKNKKGVTSNAEDVLSISHNSTKQNYALSDPTRSKDDFNESEHSSSGSPEIIDPIYIIKQHSSQIKHTSKNTPANSVQNTSASDVLDTLVGNKFKNLPEENKNRNNILSEKKEMTAVSNTEFNHKSHNRFEGACYDTNNDELNKDMNFLGTFSSNITASKLSKNISSHLHQGKNETSTSLKSKAEECTNLQRTLIAGPFNQPRESQKDTSPAIIGSNPSSISRFSIDSQLERYTHNYKTAFDDNGEYLCMKMGDIVLLTVKEARSCKSRIVTAERFTCQQLKTNEINLAKRNFFDTLIKFKTSFLPLYSMLMEKITNSGVLSQSNEDVILLLLTWFLKMYLRVTTLAPEFMDSLNEIKFSVHALSTEKNSASKPFFLLLLQDEAVFESKCCTVAQYMQTIFNDTIKGDIVNDCYNSEQTVDIVEREVNFKPIESNSFASKPTPILESILKKNTGLQGSVSRNKVADYFNPEPQPYDCNNAGRGRHHENPEQRNTSGLIERKSNLNHKITNLSTFGEHPSYINESDKSNTNYRDQAQCTNSGGHHLSKDHVSMFSTFNADNISMSRDSGVTLRNLVQNIRPLSQKVSSNLSDDNQYKMGTKTNNVISQNQMPTSSGMSSSSLYSSDQSNVSCPTNYKPFKPELSIGQITTEMNHQVKRKSTNRDGYLAKKIVTYQSNACANTLVGMCDTSNYPSTTVENAQVNSSASRCPQRSSQHHPLPPPYPGYPRNHYFNYQRCFNNNAQPSSIPRLRGPSSLASIPQLPGENHCFQNYNHHNVHENNHFSSDINHTRDNGNSSSTTAKQSTHSNDRHIAVTINNCNITNVLPLNTVIKHSSNHEDSIGTLQNFIHHGKTQFVQEHVPKETIHYLG